MANLTKSRLPHDGIDGINGTNGASNVIDATDVVYGLSTGGTASANASALASADAAAVSAGKKLWIPKGTYSSNSVTFSSVVEMGVGSILSSSSATFAFNGGVDFSFTQHFSLTGTAVATFSDIKTIYGYAEWWGAIPDAPATDCLAAINACIKACTFTQLFHGWYYVSGTVAVNTAYRTLQGVKQFPSRGDNISFGRGSAIVSTSSSANIVNTIYTASSSTEQALYITIGHLKLIRSVAPLISSNCVGLYNKGRFVMLEHIQSNDSMIGFHHDDGRVNRGSYLSAGRTMNGTGAGTDNFIGFLYGGTGTVSGTYLEWCLAYPDTSTYTGNSTGYKYQGYINDNMGYHLESYATKYGMVITGDNATGFSGNDSDLHFDQAVLEASISALVITNINKQGSVIFDNSHFYNSGNAGPLASISNCAGHVELSSCDFLCQTAVSYAAIALGTCHVTISGGVITECNSNPITLTGSTNCDIDISIQNNNSNSQPITLTSADRNRLSVRMRGSGTRPQGYSVDNLSNYNEFNCTGIDPACITGGSANKLVINGTQVIVTGISAAGAGGNVASGVMA